MTPENTNVKNPPCQKTPVEVPGNLVIPSPVPAPALFALSQGDKNDKNKISEPLSLGSENNDPDATYNKST